MSSPQNRGKRTAHGGPSRLSEPALPLHIALAWLLVQVFPLDAEREPIQTYSATFTASALKIVAREVFEVSTIRRGS